MDSRLTFPSPSAAREGSGQDARAAVTGTRASRQGAAFGARTAPLEALVGVRGTGISEALAILATLGSKSWFLRGFLGASRGFGWWELEIRRSEHCSWSRRRAMVAPLREA